MSSDSPRKEPGEIDHGARRKSPWTMTPVRWLFVAIAAFVVVSFALSWLRSVEFQTTTWDLGLYQQAFWSTAHGRAFYEAADVETGGYGSLLQIHSVFLFYLLVPIYSLIPDPTTLFAIQSVVVAAAAFPLYLLARDLSTSPRVGLATGLVYLASTPVLSSTLYDFHPEAFLPVELFTLVLLWEHKRYGWGFAAAAIAFSTMELAPVLTFFIGLFALLGAGRLPNLMSRGPQPQGGWGRVARALRSWFGAPRVRASIGLMAASVAAYEFLLYLRVDVLTSALGTYPLAAHANGYVIGGTPGALQLSWANLSVGISQKLTYWLVAVALLGFLPFFAPRAIVLSVPWFAFTLFSANLNYVMLGYQYGFIVAYGLMVAFAYGFPSARRFATRVAHYLRRRRPIPAETHPAALRWSEVGRLRRTAPVAVLGVFVAVNLALTPLNPLMDNNPAYGAAYHVSFTPNPHDAQVDQLVNLIPPGATVLASENLFPLVANDEHAYSLVWTVVPELGLPFSPSHPPSYVLLAQDKRDSVPIWLSILLYNSSEYGVMGVVWSSDPGVVLLFGVGYSGALAQLGPRPVPQGTYFGSTLVDPPGGSVTTVPGSAYASVVESNPGALGPFWFGPGLNVAPGNVSFRLSVRAAVLPGAAAPSPDTPVLSIGAEAWGVTDYSTRLSYGVLDGSNWTTVEVTVNVPEPTIEFGIVGVMLNSSVQVTLNYLSLAAGGPS